jgi:hypothetical protein
MLSLLLRLSLQITTERFVTPGWQLLELLNGRRSELARCCSVVRGFARSIIRERRAQLTAVAAKLGGAVASPTAVLGALASDVGNADARSDTGSAAGGPASPLSSRGSAHSNILADSLASGGSAHGSNSGSCGNSPRALPPGVHDTDGESRDLLSLFLDAAGPDGQPLSDQVLEDAVINFIIAGRDTTAQVCVGEARARMCVCVCVCVDGQQKGLRGAYAAKSATASMRLSHRRRHCRRRH